MRDYSDSLVGIAPLPYPNAHSTVLDRHTALVRIEILSQVAVPARIFFFRSIFVKISFICSPFWSHV